jgi:hypothetical protein
MPGGERVGRAVGVVLVCWGVWLGVEAWLSA